MLVFPLAALIATLCCVLLHYEILRLLACSVPRLAIAPRQRMLCVVVGALGGHIAEILIFAAVLWLVTSGLAVDVSVKEASSRLGQALYVSIESYPALGSAEAFDYGPLRLFSGIEALAGLLLVGWTSAFTYWSMTQFWKDHPPQSEALGGETKLGE